ncbi:MAG TPA: N-acetylmuramoyl-L-alanine amidase, partial [Thermodesulfovibrionales bacterium]|nr:N-acetylmuramoyl-L-alanine amidase [Thermodesulfovibrionales bacterium]
VKTIMIDPGHGGSDPGTVGRMGTKEKDITLDIAKRLKERLGKYRSYRVLMTREDDTSVPLNKRVEMARSNHADLFISIHLNYLPAKPINIIETYYFGPSGDAKTRELAEKENAGSRYGLSDFRKMIEKLGETMKLQESKQLANAIQENLFVNIRKLDGSVRDFGVKRAPFVVLLGVDVPAVLAEVACLSNGKEERDLNTERYRESIANYLEAGILNYLNKGEIQHEARRQTEE